MANVPPLAAVAERDARAFVDLYYQTADTDPASLHRFYTDTSLIVANGHGYQGFAQYYTQALQPLATSSHEVQGFDAQPLAAWNAPLPASAPCNVLVQVSGVVQYGSTVESRPFTHSFLLTPNPTTPGTLYISNASFRLV
ncbi:hypothetical protein IWQ60_012426 [Tieghemiomyces parasiticus]|uniref:NTF2-related export protein n=1 Tax=Tieghemiomyces parasiticus TaxID=78921 RepID=A0A9W7ZGW0_9FUNG|nr:hypothetical protein IWQ60_012426 [Tieghemiomyces parasiticus]